MTFTLSEDKVACRKPMTQLGTQGEKRTTGKTQKVDYDKKILINESEYMGECLDCENLGVSP